MPSLKYQNTRETSGDILHVDWESTKMGRKLSVAKVLYN